MIFLLEENNEASASGLLSQVRYGLKGLLREKKIPKEYIEDLEEKLNFPFRLSVDNREKRGRD